MNWKPLAESRELGPCLTLHPHRLPRPAGVVTARKPPDVPTLFGLLIAGAYSRKESRLSIHHPYRFAGRVEAALRGGFCLCKGAAFDHQPLRRRLQSLLPLAGTAVNSPALSYLCRPSSPYDLLASRPSHSIPLLLIASNQSLQRPHQTMPRSCQTKRRQTKLKQASFWCRHLLTRLREPFILNPVRR